MKKKFLLYAISFFSATGLVAQSCKVSVDSLKGAYTGDCKKGMASGKGTAAGADSYTGYFKNGYPDGEGRYVWKNGSTYEGSWKDGLFEGEGTLHKVNSNNQDSAIDLKGFWKKGKYVGRYEKPYVVHTMTNNITEVRVRKLNSNGSEVTINVKCTTGGGSNVMNQLLPKARLVEIQQIEGRFQQQVEDETSSTVSNKYSLREVTYPFYAIFSFETKNNTKFDLERVAIEFLESSNWYVQVSIDN